MKHAKRIITILIISILTISAVFISYIGIENGAVVFADDVHFMTDQELEVAYQAYLQSKGGSFIGTAGARYAYTTGKLLNFITSDSNTTGITTIDELKSQMTWQKSYLENGNSYLSLGLTNRGMGLLNLYTQYLMQQHYFGDNVTETDGMFDTGIDNNLFQGMSVIIDNKVYLVTTLNGSYTGFNPGSTFYTEDWRDTYIYQYGSIIKSSEEIIENNIITLKGIEYYKAIRKFTSGNVCFGNTDELNGAFKPVKYDNYSYVANYKNFTNWNGRGYYILMNNQANPNNIYVSLYSFSTGNKDGDFKYMGNIERLSNTPISLTEEEKDTNTNVIFYTNNNNNVNVYPTINEGDTLYITPKVDVGVDGQVNYQPYVINEGDTISNVINNYYIDSGIKDKTIAVPSDDPAGGGGGGGSSDEPGGNLPNWTNPFPHLSPDGEGGFNFNFQLPDLNIDWNISGLTEKFPFSIPFDFVAFCRVLDAEPETPALECDIDLKLVTWHVDYDLHQFDGIASLLRNLEFIAFCIALVIMTRNMIKG